MKKVIATVFCAAFVLPAMSVMASSEATHNSAANKGQEMTGAASTESTSTMDHSATSADVTKTGQAGNGSSAQMNDMEGMSDDGMGSTDSMGSTSIENADATMTGRQGHSAQMESTDPMQDGDTTEHGASPSN
ncbi:hypothetical protein [Kushneria phyllosphaerae]|uniref:Methionine-rich peptide X n=1 Tax=Kushneria phyllosphaerae TaxID=2100822 RepID=A0A2R8CNF6_9GAMM|nr:hypothetical protein [Kushneria phyllosphaerae]SPJ34425.1 hypothetical protein KSP9073_02459 [Kushneria phyllosphaerae]